MLFHVLFSVVLEIMFALFIIVHQVAITVQVIIIAPVCHEFKLPALKVKIFQLNDQTDEDKFIRDEGIISVIVVQVAVFCPLFTKLIVYVIFCPE
jgi:hypothetical protein